MSKYNEQYATTMLNALQGTETLERFKQEIRAEAFDEVMNLPKHYYKTYRSGFIEEEQAIFISDIRQLKEQK
jgi:hypothetical protein